MAQLTNHTIKQFTQHLDESIFSASAFLVACPDEGPYIQIRFIDNETYYFDIFECQVVGHPFQIISTPGAVKSISDVKVSSIKECLKQLTAWTENIKNELRASNIMWNELDELKKSLNEKINSAIKDSSVYFTNDEIDRLKNTIDLLVTKVEILHQKNEITERELYKIKESLNELKDDSNDLPKKTWLRAAGNKLYDITGKILTSPAGQKILTDGAKKILQLPEI